MLVCQRRIGNPVYFFAKEKSTKKDYPNLLDITAAGHLLADETVRDGVREVKEELGIEIAFTDLIPLGVIEYSVTRDSLIDNEIANTFLYKSKFNFGQFDLQKEEVSGIVKAKLNDFSRLFSEEIHEITIEGFEVDEFGNRHIINKKVKRTDFVPHDLSYYEEVLQRITAELKRLQL